MKKEKQKIVDLKSLANDKKLVLNDFPRCVKFCPACTIHVETLKSEKTNHMSEIVRLKTMIESLPKKNENEDLHQELQLLKSKIKSLQADNDILRKNIVEISNAKKNRGMRTHKYNAKRCEIDGFKFPSLKEGRVYIHLRNLKNAGEIKDFGLQPTFVLIQVDGKKRKYSADFKVILNDGKVEYWDAKGQKTQLYNWKKDQVKMMYGIEIKEV